MNYADAMAASPVHMIEREKFPVDPGYFRIRLEETTDLR